ncbi:MAG TPA: SpoIID/LytB domain-containing protein [Vicinamibacterales bacterium]|nr:SpoIID/LytB domain-containing protein [Vicinamibacterales bacterium]
MNRRTFLGAVAAGLVVPASGFAQDGAPLRVGFLRAGGGYTQQTLPLETYVARVLAGEMLRDSQPAALEALAITIRTFALANRNRHRADGFDLCDQTHCQVLRAATAGTERAAAATASRVLLRDGLPASIYFSASCGGHTEIPSAVWPGADDPPYLPSQDDDACQGMPVWSAELEAADLLRALRAAGFRGDRLRDVRVLTRTRSGRVARLRLDGLTPDAISGQDLRVAVGRTIGWQHIKSTAFTLRKDGDAYRFSGHGSGHGVGLCVIGSARLAERGQTADAILARYFPGLEIGRRTGDGVGTDAARTREGANAVPGVVVTLPDGDDGERPLILRQVTQARDQIANALGVAPPARVTVRFHATTDDYERATNRPWFTSGALVDGTLHVLPLAVLRERGVLDRTIRHELVHLMTDQRLASRPAWVREGAAIYFAGERPIPGEATQRPAYRPDPHASCPADRELLQPVSVGALANAYARARACFVKQIDAGKNWKDVK